MKNSEPLEEYKIASENSFGNPVLYTTGAYIQPLKVVDIDGNEKWFWAVSEFVDDTFWNGEIFNPSESGTTKQNLLLE
jgi:hypothetical protein